MPSSGLWSIVSITIGIIIDLRVTSTKHLYISTDNKRHPLISCPNPVQIYLPVCHGTTSVQIQLCAMNLVLATFLALAVVGAANAAPTEASGRIIGGVNALEGEFPEICLIQWVFLGQNSNICACAILNGNHVVTAAHCIQEAPTTGRLDVLVGVLDHTVVHPQRQRIAVLSHIIHEDYSAESPRRNDIAIVSQSLDDLNYLYLTFHQPLCSSPYPTTSSPVIGPGSLICPLQVLCPPE